MRVPRARGAAQHARRWLVLSCAAIVAGALTPLTAQTPLTTDPIAAPLDEARALVGSSDPVAAQRLGEQRLTRARASGNATELMDALEYLAWVRIGRVEVAATHALLDEMRELARIESQPLWLARVLHAEGVELLLDAAVAVAGVDEDDLVVAPDEDRVALSHVEDVDDERAGLGRCGTDQRGEEGNPSEEGRSEGHHGAIRGR